MKLDSNLMTLETDVLNDKSIVSDTDLARLNRFLEEYNFAHKGSIDTIKQKKVIEKGDTIIYYQISMRADGVTVYGEHLKIDQKKTFQFWSPKKEDKNHELIDILFNLMYAQFDSQETTNYLEQLEEYFDFGLGLRKLRNEPLIFKLYGSILTNEKDNLYDFLMVFQMIRKSLLTCPILILWRQCSIMIFVN